MSEGEAMRAGAAICPPERRRDALVALAAHAGHRSAGMTATTYLHGWDLRIFEAVARQVARTDYDRVAAGIADRIVKIETSAQSDLWAPADSAPATERRDPVELMATLRLIEEGGTLEAAAVGAQMSRGALEAVVAAARGLAALKSRKGTLRLFPPAQTSVWPHIRRAVRANNAKGVP